MKRRLFLRLSGGIAFLGLPWISRADQAPAADIPPIHPITNSHIHRPIDGESWKAETGHTVVKLVGVGGAGVDAVEQIIRNGCCGTDYICCDTDALSLMRSSAAVKLQLGNGLGACGSAELACELATLERLRIAKAVAGADMVFITAGLGGATGTGAAPVVAEVARELGILTVAVVTTPLHREWKAAEGAVELARYVDALIPIPNEMLKEAFSAGGTIQDAFRASDNLLEITIIGIVEMFNLRGLVGVDFEDIRQVIREKHALAAASLSTASGTGRAHRSAKAALFNTFANVSDNRRNCSVLVSMTGDLSVSLNDYKEAMRTVRGGLAPEATVIAGCLFDEDVQGELRVTVVAFGKT